MKSRRCNTFAKTLLILFGAFAFYLFLGYSLSEQYYIFYPEIDTRYAPGYTEEKFDRIQPGMTRAQVQEILGEPLAAIPSNRSTRLYYSLDGAAWFGDYAWMGRILEIQDDAVVTVIKEIYHD